MKRLESYETFRNVSSVVLQVGANDILREVPHDKIATNLNLLRDNLNRSKNLIWTGIFPAYGSIFSETQEELRVQLNQIIKSNCQELPNCSYLDPKKVVNPQEARSFEEDSLHLSSTSYLNWVKEIRKISGGS